MKNNEVLEQFKQELPEMLPKLERTPEKDEESKQYLLELSQYRKSVALPEEVTLFVSDNGVEVIGNTPYYLFEDGQIYVKNEW